MTESQELVLWAGRSVNDLVWYLITSNTRVCMLLCKRVMMLKLSTEEVVGVSGSAAKLGHRECKPLECWGFAGPLSIINTRYHGYCLMSSTWMGFLCEVSGECILDDTVKVQLYVGTCGDDKCIILKVSMLNVLSILFPWVFSFCELSLV